MTRLDETEGGGRGRVLALGVLGVAALLQAGLAWHRVFSIDEWQHLHVAWSIAQGSLPYRDFFEHHTPGLWYLLAPWMAWSQPELDPDRAVAFLHAVRLPFVVVWAALVVLTWRLARAHAERDATAWLATALLAATPMFANVAVDVRPDGIAVVLALIAWRALIGGVRSTVLGSRDAALRFLAAGLAFGVAVVFTQKALLAIPAALACAACARANRLRNVVVVGVGWLLPLVAILVAFASIGQLSVFLESNLWVNLRWVRVVPRLFAFWTFARDSPFLVVAGTAGFVMALRGLRDPATRARGRYVVPLALAGYSAMQLVSPAPWPQYLLNHMPLLSILAAEAIVGASERLRPSGALATAWVVSLVLGVLPGLAVTLAKSRPNAPQLEGVRYVQSITRPEDAVLDGVTGYGVFRPHAFFHAHVNWDIRGMISAERRAELEEGLGSGRIAPEVVLLDDDIAPLSPTVTSYVKTHYRPGDLPDVWVRTR